MTFAAIYAIVAGIMMFGLYWSSRCCRSRNKELDADERGKRGYHL